MTKAQVIHAYGGAEVLQWEEINVADPAAGEVLLRHTAIGMNMMEIGLRMGTYPGPALPFVPGVEAAGVITEIGNEVTEFKVGDRVGYAGPPVGSYAESRVYPASRLIPLPDDIDDNTAAASMIKGITAECLLTRSVQIKSGDRVLIHAAAGATGSMCVQLARHLGAEVFGTVSSKEKAGYIKTLGCDHPIVYTEANFADQVLELTGGQGVDVCYDSIGKDTFTESMRCTSYLGTVCLFGVASGLPEPLELMKIDLETSQHYVRPSIYAYTRERADLLSTAANAFQFMREGILQTKIFKTYELADAATAHRDVESRLTQGSITFRP
ncbi:MAG: zinc-binding dehydrogenase [Gammaproteobacteria bacterium]|nr:zinc-binding dehydrogenase [Gammaproteobacteria bacterium]